MSLAKSNEDHQHEPQQYTTSSGNEKVAVSKLRSDLSQYLACTAINLYKFTSGLHFGFKTLLIGALYKEDSEIEITLDQLSWYSSDCLMAPVGAIVIGLISQHIGNRRSVLLALLINSISGILYYFVKNAVFLLIIQAMVGFTDATQYVPCTSYIAEATQPHLRSTILASGSFLFYCGNFLTVLLGTIIHWRIVSLANVGFSAIAIITVYLIPESPVCLARSGKIDEAEKSMAWLRGWTAPNLIRDELSSTIKVMNQDKSVQLKDSHDKPTFKEKFKPYLQRSFLVPLALVSYIFTMHSLTGLSSILIYAIAIFDMIESPMDGHVATVIFDALRIAGALFCVLIIQITGKRLLMFTSIIFAGSCFFIVATFQILIKQQVISSAYMWFPTVALPVATFSAASGFDRIIYMYNAELFPNELRNVGGGICIFLKAVLAAALNKGFLYAVDAVTLEGVFIFSGLVYAVSLVTFYFIIPETNGKTLSEIEDYFTKKSRRKSEKI